MKAFKQLGFLAAVVVLLVSAGLAQERPATAPSAAANPPMAAPRLIRVACMGDSITAGGYPGILNQMLGHRYEVRNLGVSGATLMKNGDFSYWNQGKIAEAEKFGANIVTIMLGTNDAKPQNYLKRPDEFLPDYKALIEAVKALPSKPKVYVVVPAPVFGKGGFNIDGSVLRKDVAPLIIKAAKETGTDMVDLFTPLADSPAMFPDNVHPSGEGATAIARILSRAISGTPVFEPDGGDFERLISVRITAYGKGTIHYTIDGKTPTDKSPVYTEPVAIVNSTTIKAISIGDTTSPVAEAKFTETSQP